MYTIYLNYTMLHATSFADSAQSIRAVPACLRGWATDWGMASHGRAARTRLGALHGPAALPTQTSRPTACARLPPQRATADASARTSGPTRPMTMVAAGKAASGKQWRGRPAAREVQRARPHPLGSGPSSESCQWRTVILKCGKNYLRRPFDSLWIGRRPRPIQQIR
jgi:hypothetical protein